MRHHYVLGVSYRTASVALRERLVLSLPNDADLGGILAPLGIQELVLVSTCNRCELYLASSVADEAQLKQELLKWWLDRAGLENGIDSTLFYWYSHQNAVEHLFRVAASLDSLLLGETQILGQLREAYLRSIELGRVKIFLHHLFQTALSLGKEVRAQTGIGRGALSISLAAVQMCKKVFGDLRSKTALVFGAGEMAHLAGLHLRQSGIERLIFCNRSLDKAQIMAERHGGEAIPWEQRANWVAGSDLLISATAAPHFVLNLSDLKSQKWQRYPKVLIDIAIPRDLDPEIQQIDGAYMFYVDDLQQVMEDSKRMRQGAIAEVEQILQAKTAEFVEWYKSREAVPAIVTMRNAYAREMQIELQKWENHPARDEIQSALHALGGRLLHQPSEVLRQLGQEGLGAEASDLMSRLFARKES